MPSGSGTNTWTCGCGIKVRMRVCGVSIYYSAPLEVRYDIVYESCGYGINRVSECVPTSKRRTKAGSSSFSWQFVAATTITGQVEGRSCQHAAHTYIGMHMFTAANYAEIKSLRDEPILHTSVHHTMWRDTR